MIQIVIISFTLLTVQLIALEIGCNTFKIEEEKGCSLDNILQKDSSFKLKLTDIKEIKKIDNQINITKRLKSIKIKNKNNFFLIKRKRSTEKQSCPPECIQPMYIKQVETVGELETLKFIQKLQKNRQMILIDTRNIKLYKQETIPSAISIPSSLLLKRSKHEKKILKILGGKEVKGKWYFKTPLKLLIFDNGIWDSTASNIILRLIELGYPQKKIIYYRGGVQSWRASGLTLF